MFTNWDYDLNSNGIFLVYLLLIYMQELGVKLWCWRLKFHNQLPQKLLLKYSMHILVQLFCSVVGA